MKTFIAASKNLAFKNLADKVLTFIRRALAFDKLIQAVPQPAERVLALCVGFTAAGVYPPWGFLFYLSWYSRSLELPQLVEEQIGTPYLEGCLFIRLYESSHISSMSLPIDG